MIVLNMCKESMKWINCPSNLFLVRGCVPYAALLECDNRRSRNGASSTPSTIRQHIQPILQLHVHPPADRLVTTQSFGSLFSNQCRRIHSLRPQTAYMKRCMSSICHKLRTYICLQIRIQKHYTLGK